MTLIGLTPATARELVNSFDAFDAEFAPSDPAAPEFLEAVHDEAINAAEVDNAPSTLPQVVPFPLPVGIAVNAALDEFHAAYDDYGKNTEWEDFAGFERYMDAKDKVGELLIAAARDMVSADAHVNA